MIGRRSGASGGRTACRECWHMQYAIGLGVVVGKSGQHVGKLAHAIGTHCTYTDDGAEVCFLGNGSSTYRVA